MQDLEENGGELTEEIAERLTMNSEDFATKMDAYANVIKNYESNIVAIKNEQERLKGLLVTAENAITSMKKVMTIGLELYGENGKTNNKIYKTPLHSYWNVYHKPLVITEEAMIPDYYYRYSLKTKLPIDAMKEVEQSLAEYADEFTPIFDAEINKKELKEDIENNGVSIIGAYIDTKASYLRIK
jgi:hypothetical protein